MPAASSGPYQSRIFNFVHRRSRRVREHLGSAFRHLRVATNWSVQAILYPIFLLFQSAASSEKQLYSSRQKSWPRLPAEDTAAQFQTSPTADQPIQRVLSLINAPPQAEARGTREGEDKGKTIHKGWNLYFFFKRIFRYASSGEQSISPSLSLPLPPTTPALSVQGIATQLSTRTLVFVTAQNEILDLLTPQQQQKLQERITNEVADYWRHWRLAHSDEQRFTTATSLPTGQIKSLSPVGYFQQLMSWVRRDELTHPSSFILHPNRALAFLDRTVAQLESSHLAPVSEVAIALARRSREIVLAVPNGLMSLSGKPLLDSSRQPAIAPEAETPWFRIQVLIWAAIDYFFGDREESKLRQTVARSINGRSTQKLVERSDVLMDGLPEPAGSQPGQKLIQHRAQEVDDLDSWLSLSDLFGSKNTQLAPAPDWIETHATAMGYVKHPLEQLLAWLDRALLWLEELLLKVMQWVQQTAR